MAMNISKWITCPKIWYSKNKIIKKKSDIIKKINTIQFEIKNLKNNIYYLKESVAAENLKKEYMAKIDDSDKEIESLKLQLNLINKVWIPHH